MEVGNSGELYPATTKFNMNEPIGLLLELSENEASLKLVKNDVML
jgi:hypothetical protein